MSCSPRQQSLIRRTFIDFQQTAEFLERPLIFDRAEGLYFWDIDGRRYFDAIGGIFVAVLGPPATRACWRRCGGRWTRMTFAPPLHGISDVTLDFVEKLGSVTPGEPQLRQGLQRRIGVDRGGAEVRPPVLQADRPPGQVQVHQPLPELPRGHLRPPCRPAAAAKRKIKFEPHMPGFLKVFSPIQLRDRFPSWEETNRFCARLFEDDHRERESGDGGGGARRADLQHRRDRHPHRGVLRRSCATSAGATTCC